MSMGRVWLGQGDTASNGTAEADVTGTAVALLNGGGWIGNSFTFFDDNANADSGIRIRNVMPNPDGMGRAGRIRYDTPQLGGLLTLSTSWVNGDAYDFGAFASGRVEGHRFVSRFGVARMDNDARSADSRSDWRINWSGSVATSFGLTAAVSVNWDDAENVAQDNIWQYGGKIGWQFTQSPLGNTAVTASFFRSENQRVDGDHMNSFGLEFVQNIDAIAGEVYLAGRRFKYDDKDVATDLRPIWVASAGSRIRF